MPAKVYEENSAYKRLQLLHAHTLLQACAQNAAVVYDSKLCNSTYIMTLVGWCQCQEHSGAMLQHAGRDYLRINGHSLSISGWLLCGPP